MTVDSEGRSVDYYQYIQSPEWHERAEAAKQRAGFHCQLCNADDQTTVLNVHHRTYERLGHEPEEDIIVLCRACHELSRATSAWLSMD
jgi:5-methylcytosine-specific restriction endonuclease McrA